EEVGGLSARVAGHAGDAPALVRPGADQLQDLGARVAPALLPAVDPQIRPEERALVPPGPPHPELANDVPGDLARRGRGQRQDRHAERVSEPREPSVARAEIVAPLRD